MAWMMRFYDLPIVVNLSRLSYLIVGENLIIFNTKSIEESNNLEEWHDDGIWYYTL
jgi:hypothetical protein